MRKFLLSVLLCGSLLMARKLVDIVETREGNTYIGNIVSEDTASLFIELEGGSKIRIQRSNILKIQHDLQSDQMDKGFHRHDGFYLTMAIGPGFGKMDLEGDFGPATSVFSVSGTGMHLDFGIGGAITEDLILSYEVWERIFTSPDAEIDGTGIPSDSLDAANVGMGVGITKYFRPHNIFAGAAFGFGVFMLNENTNSEPASELGPSLRLKAGKEWWVSKNWGLGATVGYVYASAKDMPATFNSSYSGKFSTNEFYLLFSATFN